MHNEVLRMEAVPKAHNVFRKKTELILVRSPFKEMAEIMHKDAEYRQPSQHLTFASIQHHIFLSYSKPK